MTSMIEMSGLTKRFGDLIAVDDISFSLQRGEVLGFLGPNGAGKSTTMKMLTGFLHPDGGTASICGFDVVDDPLRAQARIGYLPEGAPLYGDMTPAAFLDFVAEIRGLAGADKRRRIAETATQVRINEVLHRPIDTLSKGYRRRVGLAQAIVHDPDVLILDEPTDGLDPNQKAQVRRLIREMAPRKAIIVSTHILEEVDSICTRAMIVSRGQLVFDGTPRALERRSRYRNAVRVECAQQAEEDRAAAVLSAVEGVAQIERPEAGGVVALPLNGASIVAPVRDALEAASLPVIELHVERGRLDDVFGALTGHVGEE